MWVHTSYTREKTCYNGQVFIIYSIRESLVLARRFPSLNALRTFEAAARNMSFSEAAVELNVTQAAVSRQIRILEEDLGVALFRRLTRAVDLTSEGTLLYPPLHDALDQIERATARIWSNRGSGILTISVLPTFSVKWLMPRLLNFSEQHPEIEVHLVNSIKPAEFDRDEIDLAIRVGSTNDHFDSKDKPRIDLSMTNSWNGLQVEELMDDELVAVMSPEYARIHGAITSETDLERVTLLQMATRPNAWPDYFKAIDWTVSDPTNGPSYGHFFMTLQAAAESKGVALLPLVLSQEDLRNGTVVRAMPKKVASAGSYYLLGKKQNWDQSKVKIFRQWLRAEIDANNVPA